MPFVGMYIYMDWKIALLILFLVGGPLVYQKSILVESQSIDSKKIVAPVIIIEEEKKSQTGIRAKGALDSGIIPLPELQENSVLVKLESQVVQKNKLIESTEKEIAEINQKLDIIGKEKVTLEAQLRSLSLTNSRNKKQILLTQENINRSQLKLEGLNENLDSSTDQMTVLYFALIENYRRSNEFVLGDKKLLVLFGDSAFGVIKRIDEITTLTGTLADQTNRLRETTIQLEKDKTRIALEKSSLQVSEKELNDRQRLYEVSTARQQRIVNETRNNETEYQALLATKLEERRNLQQELFDYESRIEYIKNPNTLPTPRRGILRWPINETPRITQGFGATEFARSSRSPYARPFHSGVDFGVSSNTKLYATANGKVVGTGNTDLVRSCQLWGKWIAIKHDNGLTTLYAHLSLIRVRVGQRVTAGELVGYSGNTGQSTGPHLHFGLYASGGFRIIPYEEFSSKGLCKGLLIPAAPNNAKLNPLEYLPEF